MFVTIMDTLSPPTIKYGNRIPRSLFCFVTQQRRSCERNSQLVGVHSFIHSFIRFCKKFRNMATVSTSLNKFANSEVELRRVGCVNVGSRDPVYNFLCCWWQVMTVIVEKVNISIKNSRSQTAIESVQSVSAVVVSNLRIVFTPPTRRNLTVESRRRSRRVLGIACTYRPPDWCQLHTVYNTRLLYKNCY